LRNGRSMLPIFFQPANLLSLIQLLFRIDQDLADQRQTARCPHCDGPLHHGNYQRKPRGLLDRLPDKYFVRQSFCCGNPECRRRCLPSSVLFMGRRVYWHGVILVIMALRQRRPQSASKASLMELFEVSRQTINRWVYFFHEIFPKNEQWQRLRGMVGAQVDDRELPSSLLNFFGKQYLFPDEAFLRCLRFLAFDFST